MVETSPFEAMNFDGFLARSSLTARSQSLRPDCGAGEDMFILSVMLRFLFRCRNRAWSLTSFVQLPLSTKPVRALPKLPIEFFLWHTAQSFNQSNNSRAFLPESGRKLLDWTEIFEKVFEPELASHDWHQFDAEVTVKPMGRFVQVLVIDHPPMAHPLVVTEGVTRHQPVSILRFGPQIGSI